MKTKQCTAAPNRPLALIATTLALGLAACGGGGGDGQPTDVDPGIGDLRITAANRDTVARAAAVAVVGGVAQSSTIGLAADRQTALAAAAPRADHRVPGAAGIALAALKQALASLQRSRREEPATVLPPDVTNCSAGGTRTLTFDDRDNSGTASAGDVIDVLDAACRDAPDEKTDGRMVMTLISAQAAPTQSLVAGARFENYTLTSLSSARRSALSGDFTLSMAEVDANRTNIEMKVGTGLAVGVTHPSYTDTVTLTPGYTITMVTWLSSPIAGDAGQPLLQLNVNGTVRSQAAGGTFLIWLPGSPGTPFSLLGSDVYPRAGHAQLQTYVSLMWVTALASGQARVEVDYEGNGSIDSSQDVAWETLI